MNKTFLAIAAAATLATGFATVAAPASAGTAAIIKVDYDRHHDNDRDGRFGDRDGWRGDRDGDRDGGRRFDGRIAELDQRIERGRYSGQLSRREASRLSDRLDSIRWTKRDYERSGRGIDRREAAILDDKLDNLSRDVFGQRRDGNRW